MESLTRNSIKVNKQRSRPTLSTTIDKQLHERLHKDVGKRRIAAFVEQAIIKEFREWDKKQKKFAQQLITSYKKESNNKDLSKEEAIWEGAVGDGVD